MGKVKQVFVDLEEERREHEGPDQEPDSAVIVASYIAALGSAVPVVLFVAMVAVWAAIGSGSI